VVLLSQFADPHYGIGVCPTFCVRSG
jgi:hypothetical protein